MVERRSESRLALKPRPRSRASQFIGEELNRNETVQLRIPCAVDHTHAAGSQAGLENIGAKLQPRIKLRPAVMGGMVSIAAAIPRGTVQHSLTGVALVKKGNHLAAHFLAHGTCGKKRGALRRVLFERSVIEFFDLPPVLGVHTSPSVLSEYCRPRVSATEDDHASAISERRAGPQSRFSGSGLVFLNLRHWPEEVVTHVLGDLPADLCAMQHRMPPMQTRPDARVIDLAHEAVDVLVRALYFDQLRYRAPVRGESPSDFSRAEEPRDSIRESG
jgi:hypothetical protein